MAVMKIFALETNDDKLEKSFLSRDEEVILRIKFSGFLFIVRMVRSLLITAVLIGIGAALASVQIPLAWIVIGLVVLWVVMAVLPSLTAYIDWRYDTLLITTEEVIWVDQSSLFHVHIRQMNLDNIASVSAETQYWNVFPFGKLHFDLKEGVGKSLTLPYVPQAARVAAVVSDSIVRFQRRKAAGASAAAMGAPPVRVRQAEKNVDPVLSE